MTSTYRLGDLVDIFDGPHATPKKTEDGPVFLGISNLVAGRLDLTVVEHLSEDDYLRWTRRVEPRRGDVVFSYETRLGEAASIPDGLRCCLGRRMGLLRAKSGRIDPRFLLYGYLGPDFQEVLRSRTVRGSTVDRIPLIEMPEFPMRVPPIHEQQAIASILGALDDKIELNRQMNETLEELARTIFKSCFVDFDPVRVKAEGRQPVGIDAEMAALFPSRFVESELGEIPEGWRIAPLGEWADALSGGTPAKSNASLWGGDLPWISPKVMTEIHADEADAFVTGPAVGNGTRLAPSGSTLVMVRGMGLHKEVRVSQARREVTFNQDVKALVPKGIEPTLLLLALLDAQPTLLGRVQSSGHGTGVLPTDILLAQRICLPPSGVQKRLVTPLDAMNDLIAAGRSESRTLTELRDLLLPKLISGELRIPEAEKLVEAVA